jgi:hypothetical protein
LQKKLDHELYLTFHFDINFLAEKLPVVFSLCWLFFHSARCFFTYNYTRAFFCRSELDISMRILLPGNLTKKTAYGLVIFSSEVTSGLIARNYVKEKCQNGGQKKKDAEGPCLVQRPGASKTTQGT